MLKYFNIESTKIACWINSSDFGAHKQSLIFIHGSGGDHSLWSLQYAKLHKHYNVVAIDLPGHGHSQGSGESDVGNYCLWVRKLMDVLNLKNPILVGHSLGAAITLQFALNYPQEIKGIVPVGGGMKMPVNPSLLVFLKTNPAEAIDLICKLSLAKENRPKFFATLKKSLSQVNTDVLYGDFLACSKLDLTEKISKINLPALVLCGTEDKMMPPDFSRQIAGGIGGAKLCLIEGAGHMVMMERPKEFNEALNKFALSIAPGR
jgi:pimeloyl-ACP methyl ester carboxylesterase